MTLGFPVSAVAEAFSYLFKGQVSHDEKMLGSSEVVSLTLLLLGCLTYINIGQRFSLQVSIISSLLLFPSLLGALRSLCFPILYLLFCLYFYMEQGVLCRNRTSL